MKNYYQILGLEPSCSDEQVRIAFREYAKHYHPDKHQGSQFFAEKFIEAKEAYDILSNPVTRIEHDEYHGLNIYAEEQQGSFQYQNSRGASQKTQTQEPVFSTQDTASTNAPNSAKRQVTEEDYYKWALLKLENNDYLGALSEVADGMKKFPRSGLLECAEAEVQEAFGYYWRARKSYKRAFDYGIIEAKNEFIRIESLLDSGIEIYKKYLLKTVMFCTIGLLIVVVANATKNLGAGIVIGFIVNLIGMVLISKSSQKEVPKRLSENFQYYSFEFNLYLIATVIVVLGGVPLVAYLLP